MIEAEFGQDVLEAEAPGGRLSAVPLVRIDDLDAVAGPAQGDGQVGEGILPRRRFLVVGHLLGAGLADVDDGFAVQMAVANLGGAREGSNLLIEQYNQAVLNAVRDVAQTGSRLQALDAQTELQKRRIESIAFTRDSVEAHYQRGLTSRLAALDARQPVIAEQVALLTLNGQVLSQEIALTKALGGGYLADPPVELKPR